MGRNAARKGRGIAVLKSALTGPGKAVRPWWRNKHMLTYVGHFRAAFRKIL